jgi:diguanylate cyclase (GGDEF)-like protein
LRGWSLGLSLCGLGWLVLNLRGSPPPIAMSLAANTLIVTGYSVVWLSARRFDDHGLDAWRVALCVLFFAALFAAVWFAGADVRDRIIMVSFLTGCLALLAGWEIYKGGREEPLRGRVPTTLAFVILGSTMLARAGLSLYDTRLTPPPEFDDPARGIALFATTICLVGVTLGLSMMANERLRNRYAKLALTDELTELPNRRFFLEQGDRLSRRALMDAAPACVLLMDLDHFSSVNDRFGHAGGDQALVAFAALLRRAMRPTDLVARYGGEEFSAFLVGADLQEGARTAERLRKALDALSIEVRGQVIKSTVSIGVAALKEGDLRAAIRKADEALYQAKSLGRNQIAVAPDRNPPPSIVPQGILI